MCVTLFFRIVPIEIRSHNYAFGAKDKTYGKWVPANLAEFIICCSSDRPDQKSPWTQSKKINSFLVI